MHFFKTHSSPRKSVLIVICTFIPLFLLAFWGLKIAVITWLYFEAVLLLTFVFCLFLVSRTHWEIEFQDNNINLVNTGNHHSYRIEALSQSDLIIRQTEKQKHRNSCDLEIANTPFQIYDVKRCKKLLLYIQEHIPVEIQGSGRRV